ncbi:MAG: Holliday junction DNA helicase RuvB C-terminal domain-containing protein, partial [Ectothiorhodospira sp.]
ILDVGTTVEGAEEMAKRSRGTPRVANRLLRRVRDYAQVRADGVITGQVADDALKMLDVDQYGLDEMDARIIKTLIENFEGGPAGLNTLAVAVGEECVCPPQAVPLPPSTGWTAVGRGWTAHEEVLLERLGGCLTGPPDGDRLPRAAEVARLAVRELALGRAVAPEAALPVYLRDRVADRPGEAGR